MQKKMIKFLVLLLVLVQVIDVVGMFRHLSVAYAQETTEQNITAPVMESTQGSTADLKNSSSDQTKSVVEDSHVSTDTEESIENVKEIQEANVADEVVFKEQEYEMKTDFFPQQNNTDGTPKLDYLVGEEITLYSHIMISGGNFQSDLLRFRITLSKQYFKKYGVVSGGVNIEKSELSEDDENFYLDIYLKGIKTGTEISIPFKVKFETDRLYHGTKVPVTQQLSNEDGETLSENSLELEAATLGRSILFAYNYRSVSLPKKYVTEDNLVHSDYIEEVSYSLQSEHRNSTGMAICDSLVEIKLTENTIFNLSDNDSKWSYNAEKHSISRKITKSEVPKSHKFKVRYKNVSLNTSDYPVVFKATTNLLNSEGEIESRVIPRQANGYRQFVEYVEPPGISTQKSMSWSTSNAMYYLDENKDVLFNGIIYANYNKTEGSTFLKKIEDVPLKVNGSVPFSITSAQIFVLGGIEVKGKARLIGAYSKDGQEQKVVLSENAMEKVDLQNNKTVYDYFYVEFDNPVELTKSSQRVELRFTAKRTSDYWEYLANPSINLHYIYNKGIAHFDDTVAEYGAYIATMKVNHNFGLLQYQTRDKVFIDEVFDLTFFSSIEKPTDKKLLNPKFYMILPKGAEVKNIADQLQTTENISYTVEENFSGTRKTAIIITPKKEWTLSDVGKIFGNYGLKFSLSFNESTSFGDQTIDCYFTYENNGSTGIAMKEYSNSNSYKLDRKDSYKLISEATEEKELLNYKVPITIIPPLSLHVDTAAAIDNQEGFVNGRTEHIDQGATFKQQISIGNYSSKDINQLVGVNVLPHVGDLSTVVGADGSYHPRGSELGYSLEGPVEGEEGYIVYYSYDKPSSNMTENSENKTWITSDVDYSKVTMIKVVLDKDNGAILKRNETATFTFTAKVPVDSTIKNSQKIVNSFTVSKDGKNWIESRVSEIPVTAYQVQGLVYQDTNKNSLKDPGESALKEYEVELLNKESLIKGSAVAVTTTNNEGKYEFANVTARGEYTVRIKTKDGDVISEHLQSTSDVAATDVKPDQLNAGVADVLLAPDTASHTINMGIYQSQPIIAGSVELTKIDSVTKKVLSGAKFQLATADGSILEKELITNIDGKIIIENLPLGKYQFLETLAPAGYELDSTPVNFELVDGTIVKVAKENTRTIVPESTLGSVELTKIDSITKQILQGAEFRLETADGIIVHKDLITNSAGKIAIKDLPLGRYQFIETKAPDGYKLDEIPVSFEISNSSRIAQVTKENVRSTDLSLQSQITKRNRVSDNKTGRLPKTGNQELMELVHAGYLMLLSFLIMLFLKEKRMRNDKNNLNY